MALWRGTKGLLERRGSLGQIAAIRLSALGSRLARSANAALAHPDVPLLLEAGGSIVELLQQMVCGLVFHRALGWCCRSPGFGSCSGSLACRCWWTVRFATACTAP